MTNKLTVEETISNGQGKFNKTAAFAMCLFLFDGVSPKMKKHRLRIVEEKRRKRREYLGH